jgi:DNA replication protein DnaC
MAESESQRKRNVRARIHDDCRAIMLSNTTADMLLEQATAGQLDFFDRMVEGELSVRLEARKARCVKKACFPGLKSFDGYDFSGLKFPSLLSKEKMLSLDFIGERKTIVFLGGCGSGKTHAMTALGIMACNQCYKVRFFTVSHLVAMLVQAKGEGTQERMFDELRKLDLLLLDELCYVPLDREGAQLLFRVISETYEHKALVITTNLPFSEWGKFFTDEQLAAAIIDRIVHYGHLVATGDRDWRLEHSLMHDQDA